MAADRILGPPLVYPNYGNFQNTWSQALIGSFRNFIELEFPQEVYVTKINIFETYHAGAITRIQLRNKKLGAWITAWENSHPLNIDSSRMFSPSLEQTYFKTNQVRLEINNSAANTFFCQIDAVGKPNQIILLLLSLLLL